MKKTAWKSIKKNIKHHKNKILTFLYSIKMSAETLRFVDVEVNKKGFHASKQPIALDLVDINQIVISEKFKHNDKVSKYFIGYKDDDVIRLLCNVLPRMSGYIKYFDNGAKNNNNEM